MRREYPDTWPGLPRRVKEAVHSRVQQQLPDIVRSVTDEIGAHIDQLLDIKLMVIRRIEENPEMANRIYLEVGRKELRFIINFGFFFGALLGVPLVFLTQAVPALVGPPHRRRDHRLRHQLGRALDDLRAGRAAPVRPAQGPWPVHPAPARGIGGLWRDHRGGHRHAAEHRRRAPARPELGPDAPDDRGSHAPRGRPGGRPRPAGGQGRARERRVRHDPRVRRQPRRWTTR